MFDFSLRTYAINDKFFTETTKVRSVEECQNYAYMIIDSTSNTYILYINCLIMVNYRVSAALFLLSTVGYNIFVDLLKPDLPLLR